MLHGSENQATDRINAGYAVLNCPHRIKEAVGVSEIAVLLDHKLNEVVRKSET